MATTTRIYECSKCGRPHVTYVPVAQVICCGTRIVKYAEVDSRAADKALKQWEKRRNR